MKLDCVADQALFQVAKISSGVIFYLRGVREVKFFKSHVDFNV
jgi:hypothetical protein